MNIQIFGAKKCFDTKKAERWFKERGIKFQSIDMKEKGMSRGEFDSVKRAVGGIDELINESAKDKDTLTLMKYLSDSDREDKLFENQHLIRTPIVRSGAKATIGFCPEIWGGWE
ncbi:MAG: arsenate reductase family protein [Ruminococcus sp.]|nr:arsenate reductase family protein [Ruminococcus sp.]